MCCVTECLYVNVSVCQCGLPSTAQYCTPIPSPSSVSLTDTFLELARGPQFPEPRLQSTGVSVGSVCGPECYNYTDYNQFTSQLRYQLLWPGCRWLMPMSQIVPCQTE